MKVPQSQSPSAPLRLWDIEAHWDVVARRSGAAGLRGCGASRPCDIGAMGLRDCGTAGPWGCGTSWLWGVAALGRVGGVRPCGRGVSARTHPRGAHGAVWLRDCGTVGLWDSAVGAFPDLSPRSRAKGAPRRGRGAGLGWLVRRTPRAGLRRRGARRPGPVSPCDWSQGYCFSKTRMSSSLRTRSSAARTSSGRQSLSSPRS